jgi:hypothetical protein
LYVPVAAAGPTSLLDPAAGRRDVTSRDADRLAVVVGS